MWVTRAASRLVAHDNGFSSEFSTCSILRWSADIDKKIQEGVSSTLIASNLYKKRISHVEKIESMNPGYLHFLYRHTIRTKGPNAIWKELAEVINLKSDTPAETRPSIDLSSKKLINGSTKTEAKKYQKKKNH